MAGWCDADSNEFGLLPDLEGDRREFQPNPEELDMGLDLSIRY